MNANQDTQLHELFGEVIYSYTRAQAIEDGVLIDISETAREAGFRFPVAITSAAWADCVAWSEEDNTRKPFQDEAGRLWDVVWMLGNAVRRSKGESSIPFELYRVPREGNGRKAKLTTLKAVCGPGDDMEPVITIMLPHED
jgi:hypothetical protein